MKLSEEAKQYERWTELMKEGGLAYGPADVFIALLESENESLRALAKHGIDPFDIAPRYKKIYDALLTGEQSAD